MSAPQISFIRLSETTCLVAAPGLSPEHEISADILLELGVLSRVGISRLERANTTTLSLFWFSLPERPAASMQGLLKLRLDNSIHALHEISLDDFLSRFFSSQVDIANFFDLLFRVLVPALKLQRNQGFAALLNKFCKHHSTGKIHSFYARDLTVAILRIHRDSRRKPKCRTIALIGAEIGLTRPRDTFPSHGRAEGNFIFSLDAHPELSSSKFCILVLENAIIVAVLVTRNYASIRELVTSTGILQPDVSAALHASSNTEERRRIDRAAASLPSKSSVALSVPNQVRFDLQTVISLTHGLFVAGWWIDPSRAVKSVEVVDYSLEGRRVSHVWSSYKTHINVDGRNFYVDKFVAFLPRKAKKQGPLRPTVLLKMADGEVHTLTIPIGPIDPVLQRKAIIDHVDERALDPSLIEKVFLPAITALQDQINSRQGIEEHVQFSSPSLRKVSIIIPLYRNVDFIRHQLFAFHADPFISKHCEIVYVNDDPAYGLDLKILLEGYSTLLDVDICLLLLAQNGGYSLANNLAVKAANGDILVLMNSDIVPEASGWLEGLLERLENLPKYSVIGPKLLYADDTLQHAGMYFLRHFSGFWQNMHYYKGYGRDFPPANEERSVGAVTGACLVTRKSDFLDVGGFSTEFVIGDYEDSDLCFKLRQKGGVCLYAANVALYHFERQSMQTNTLRNDSTTSAYNRALNFLKWKGSGLEMGYLEE